MQGKLPDAVAILWSYYLGKFGRFTSGQLGRNFARLFAFPIAMLRDRLNEVFDIIA